MTGGGPDAAALTRAGQHGIERCIRPRPPLDLNKGKGAAARHDQINLTAMTAIAAMQQTVTPDAIKKGDQMFRHPAIPFRFLA